VTKLYLVIPKVLSNNSFYPQSHFIFSSEESALSYIEKEGCNMGSNIVGHEHSTEYWTRYFLNNPPWIEGERLCIDLYEIELQGE